MKLDDPFPGHYDASDPFGNTAPPRTSPHTGSDWNGLPEGTPIPAIGSGQVVAVGFNAGNGYYLCQTIASGLYVAYLHQQNMPDLAVGDPISRGRLFGRLGNTGSNSNGAHLHITISDSPSAYLGLGNKVDPYAYILANQSSGNLRWVLIAPGIHRLHRVV